MNDISVRGAYSHNLKNVSIDIPKNSLVVVTGVSGSGKSSLVFNTIFAEAFRRFAEASGLPLNLLDSAHVSRIRGKFISIDGLPVSFGISQKQNQAGYLSTVGTLTGITDLFRVIYAAYGEIYCRQCDISLRACTLEEMLDAINADFFGEMITIIAPIAYRRKGAFAKELEKFRKLGFSKLRINGEVFDLQDDSSSILIDPQQLNTIELLVDRQRVGGDRLSRIENAVKMALDNANGIVKIEADNRAKIYNLASLCPQCGESVPILDPRFFSHSSLGQCQVCRGRGTLKESCSDVDLYPCPSCKGSRLSSNLPLVRLQGKGIDYVLQNSLHIINEFVDKILLPKASPKSPLALVLNEIFRMLGNAIKLGQGHQILGRSALSLSPGDIQRLRLASIMAAPLTGALYILDEPCQGLADVEVNNLVEVLRELLKKGCSCLVVEHHPEFVNTSDLVITMGPGAGKYGGQIVSVNHDKLECLNEKQISSLKNKISDNYIEILNLKIRNVCKDKIVIYSGGVTILRGRSGSGKMTILNQCIKPCLEKLLDPLLEFPKNICNVKLNGNVQVSSITEIRPGSLKRSSRRVVAAALEILPYIRDIYAKLFESQMLGLSAPHFSWSSSYGRCGGCDGKGYNELKQKYGPPLEIICEECQGDKLKSNSLKPRFKGYSIAEILALSVDDALELFQNFRLIEQRLRGAQRFGLGYLSLNQSLESLSGGELQRLLLTLEFRKSDLQGSWYLLEHPSTGLHSPDIEVLGNLIGDLAQKGGSFVLVENREEFSKFATNIIEI